MVIEITETDMNNIEVEIDEKWNSRRILFEGESLGAITEASGLAKIQKYIELCQNCVELPEIVRAAAERVKWNWDNPGKGKDWPQFRAKERLIKKFLKEAGIKDS